MPPADEQPRDAKAAPPPDSGSGPPERIWEDYFRDNRPGEFDVRNLIERLHEAGEHEHVIHAIQAALIHGQSQPWMYEVLALSMEIAGRPEQEVQRVVMSLTDFGNANFASMMYSAAYLTRFERRAAALRLYRQASRLAPERPEPYILGLKLARASRESRVESRESRDQRNRSSAPQEDSLDSGLSTPDSRLDALRWAALGILRYGWTKDYVRIQRDAENALLEEIRRLQRSGQSETARRLSDELAEARRRDLSIRVDWSGPADLDLIVEEPAGTVCSFESPDSLGGGVHLHDGFGPEAANCFEQYVCPMGLSGEYRIRVRHAWGDVVGKRAQLTITRHQGSDREQTSRQTVLLGPDDAVVRVTLADGRRQQPRTVQTTRIEPRVDVAALQQTSRESRVQSPETSAPGAAGEHVARDARLEAAWNRFADSRRLAPAGEGLDQRMPAGFLTGAVGFQPVITFVPEGAQLRANVLVSPDRRYVRLGISPTFTNLTDVFTFSFLSGNPTIGPGGGFANPPGN